ncbi:hypothetical protein AX774_g1905 [Zancudomyces culisetae]|uniref:Velvet domain-containing protein n=1 Tax=Zancudomyces culisetae TaxID=1213189 RepID=A0A1R1PUA7_ZANCU|nr:hypothetical protein AX774_g1905 [Zancudomyces culisetae]|eukprot:OMH84576.1 hypothetical protein AX774_g1905 [Zancudomyces culisetae]
MENVYNTTHMWNSSDSHKTLGRKYCLKIVQNPIRARMCGFGEKDRRPIDPPPVVQLFAFDEYENPVELDDIESSKMVTAVTLWSENGAFQCDFVINPASLPTPQAATYNNAVNVLSLHEPIKMKNLVGITASSGLQLRDDKNNLGTFFIFNDLSVRTEGRFVLRFSVTDINGIDEPLRQAKVLSEVQSSPFDVYSAKNFPGMTGKLPTLIIVLHDPAHSSMVLFF